MKISILYHGEAFANHLYQTLKNIAGCDEINLYKLNESCEFNIYSGFDASVDLMLFEYSSICHNESVALGAQLRLKNPLLKIVYISTYFLPYSKRKMLDNGCMYLLKNEATLSEIQRIVGTPERFDLTVTKLRKQHKQLLTPTEISVLQMTTSGLKQLELATELGVSVRTVNNHLASIYKKLKVTSNVGAVVKGIEQGIVSVSYVYD